MAGHSKFSNIKHKKEANDKKRSKEFTKLAKAIAAIARQCPDPDKNPRLKTAIHAAKSKNMPKENIDRAIKKASDKDCNIEMSYTGYGPHGIAFMIETITDNSNRTVSELRALFKKYGKGLSDLRFIFEKVYEFCFVSDLTEDEVIQLLMESGAEKSLRDIKIVQNNVMSGNESNGVNKITIEFENLDNFDSNFLNKFNDYDQKIVYCPKEKVFLKNDEQKSEIKNFLEILEDNEDVQEIWNNLDMESFK
ncbi:YebC/PmpR family DNA-binding transcriptional regulator [Candidatus Nesciobacter abundans]|uniref:YebC/PmpR family DNA-binding transcriptional regulator n=1 Tax=Candidatus Nesciobacter abundans TaxID=2601668 RepID=UPI0016539824|nr:YebC/PmpR family DNA-binding transcriptional regulator [Candidatus Nesciobacter abundans]